MKTATKTAKTKAHRLSHRLSRQATEQFVDEVFEGAVDPFVDDINFLRAEGQTMTEAMHTATVTIAVALTRVVYEHGYDADRVCPILAANMVIDRYFEHTKAASAVKAGR